MDNELETLRRLWPYLTDVGREAVLKFAEAVAISNGYEEPSPTVFHVQDKKKAERDAVRNFSRVRPLASKRSKKKRPKTFEFEIDEPHKSATGDFEIPGVRD